jgi:DNA-binding transcriptional MerR regulator/methylmalonyl-CoA mutase cobalamin-binding subunit
MDSEETTDFSVNISVVERETGLSKDTLRVWERRYGFPQPTRDANGERSYPVEQVDRLRLIRRLMDQGIRPGKIVAAPMEVLSAHLEEAHDGEDSSQSESAQSREVLALIKAHQATELREFLGMMLLRLGLKRFVTEVIAPLNRVVGTEWAQGRIAIFEEHFYTEQVQHLLRHAIGSIPHSTGRPRVLLTTLPGEEHQLGLLMAHACLAVEGAQCVSLGLQTPAREISQAAIAHCADVVGISFSTAIQVGAAMASLADLRRQLDTGIALWAGGSLWQRSRRRIDGVEMIPSLTDIPRVLDAWRANHGL